jgi:hypothetical protein
MVCQTVSTIRGRAETRAGRPGKLQAGASSGPAPLAQGDARERYRSRSGCPLQSPSALLSIR